MTEALAQTFLLENKLRSFVRSFSSRYTVTRYALFRYALYARQLRKFCYACLPREAMLSAVYAVVVCLCMCVCLSHSAIVSKWLNVGSRKQHRTIAP